VLTKPDTIERGTDAKWKAILQNEEYMLKLGYYMVKMASKEQMLRKLSTQQLFDSEEQFFIDTKPWSEFSKNNNRFGIMNLKTELSRSLTKLIEQSLPKMKKSTENALLEVNELLDSFPPAVSGDVKIELLQTIRHFSTLVYFIIN
jgi:hypothetical protein